MQSKTVLITGGSYGLGYELAQRFARDGYSLILVARDQKRLDEAAKVLTSKYNVLVKVYSKDLSTIDSAQELYAQVKKDGYDVEILVNNAGVGFHGEFIRQPLQNHVNLIELNITNLTCLMWLFLRDMRKRNSGKVLNIASVAGFLPGPLMSTYYASKAYVVSLSQALSHELRGTNITVTVSCPGPVITEFQKKEHMESTLMFNSFLPMSAASVAEISHYALLHNKKIVVPGFKNKLFVFLERFLPLSVLTRIAVLLNKKRA